MGVLLGRPYRKMISESKDRVKSIQSKYRVGNKRTRSKKHVRQPIWQYKSKDKRRKDIGITWEDANRNHLNW